MGMVSGTYRHIPIDLSFAGAGVSFILISSLLLMFYAAFIGARAFSNEKTGDATDYLFTRPIAPTIVLMTKYFIRLFQIISLTLLIFLNSYNTSDIAYFLKNNIYWFDTSALAFVAIICVYSTCFLVSILGRDIIRNVIIGFPSGIFISTIVTLFLYHRHHWPEFYWQFYEFQAIYEHQTLFVFGLFELLITIIIFLGIISVVYLSYTHKRLIWINSVLITLVVCFGINTYSKYLVFGSNIISVNVPIDWSTQMTYFWDKKIYGHSPVSDLSAVKIEMVDVNDPQHPVSKNILELPRSMADFAFYENYLYIFQRKFEETIPQLTVYDLNQIDKPNAAKAVSVNLPIDQSDDIRNSHSSIRVMKDTIFISWENYHDRKSGNIRLDRNSLSIITTRRDNSLSWYTPVNRGFPRPTLGEPNLLPNSDILQGRYALEPAGDYTYLYDTSIYRKYWWERPIPIKKLDIPIYAASNYVVQGNYLFNSSLKHPLEIYDISDILNPISLSKTEWKGLDRLLSKFRYQSVGPFGKSMVVNDNRAIIFYSRGFLVFDISNPQHPRQIYRMNTYPIDFAILDGNYLYTCNAVNPWFMANHNVMIYKLS